ncbi:hypothetical protein [Phenylobacterium soli]|uniref:Uncharacterized protein n=1 Tax=Phenylobacterium soli TaxID=2170551 RepID=A0A328AFS2_9CAUL|nr:hypothetical protein [Phenylobacterium soli]RAK53461.1 hypothetical protein DJ017_02425 [Phenylobacterium soli]
MSKGSYRGGSTLTGWNANGYVPASRKLKARGRTAQSKAESALKDELVRKRHGLMPRKPDLRAKDEAKVEAKQNLRKKSRTTAPIVVKLKRRRAKTRGLSPLPRQRER